jgi:GNAT superfamily N-acetyltransferase
MDRVHYRQIRNGDFYYLRRIVGDAWELNAYSENKFIRNLLLQHYLYSYLSIQNYMLVADINNIPVGFIMGRCDKIFDKSKTYKYRRRATIIGVFLRLFLIGRIYLRNKELIEKADHQMMQHRTFDAELVLFAVDDKYRRHGIGKYLLNEFKQYATNNSAKHLYLFTDCYSDVDYYRSRGYKQLGQTEVQFFDEKDKMSEFFLFGFDL